MSRKISAVVWDVDGTLLDTEPLYFECYKLAATALGHPEYSFDIHRHILGRAEVGPSALYQMSALPISRALIVPRSKAQLLSSGCSGCRP